jgi:D-glycero-alpha-D-manno-heptose-7-phosphate kinase
MANQEGQLSIYVRAPLRIDFAGSWSDDPAFVDRDGGCVVNAAIALHVHVDFLPGGKTIRLFAEDLDDHLTVSSPAQLIYDGRLDRHKAALNMLPVTGGLEILSRSDVPPGCGLGESAALDIALLAGLAIGRMEEYDADELVDLGIMLDAGELGHSGKRQDHCAAVFGGFLELRFSPESIERQTVVIGEDTAADLAEHLVLVHTGRTFFAAQTYQRIWDSYAAGEKRVTEALRGMRDIARDISAVLAAGNWEALAGLVDRNWQYQRNLDATMVTPHTQSIETAIREAGAWGLKATGEGAGGCFLVLCPPDRKDRIAGAVAEHRATTIDVGFALEGLTVVEPEDASDTH